MEMGGTMNIIDEIMVCWKIMCDGCNLLAKIYKETDGGKKIMSVELQNELEAHFKYNNLK